jgi:rubrerythrin
MSETELMVLAREYDDLVDEAQTALRAEFARRGLEPPLIEEEEPEVEDTDTELVTVARYRDMPEAVVARTVLEDEGIECLLRDENTVRTDWLLSNAIGGMRLQVAAKDEARARELLTQPAPEQFSTDSGEEFVQPVCPKCGSLDVIANDPDRKVMAASMLIKGIPLPHRRPSEAEWRCLQCDTVWADDEEPEEALR